MVNSDVRRRRRADAKFGGMADILREKIVCGVWNPGEKLPTWDDICRDYGIGRPTLRKALDVLKSDGFIVPRSTNGTYVAEYPPHLYRYIMVFPSSPEAHGARGWNKYWDALSSEARRMTSPGRGAGIDVYFDVSPHMECPEFGALADAVLKKKTAGVIVVNGGDWIQAEVPYGAPGVYVCGTSPRTDRNAVGIDWESFYGIAAEWMSGRGRRRIAVLSNEQSSAHSCAKVLASHGMEVPGMWELSMPGTYPEGALNLTRLLFSSGNAGRRPEGLVVTDDNLAGYVVEGLRREGVGPGEVSVLVHDNCISSPSALPVKRAGFDTAEILTSALDILRRRRDSAGDGIFLTVSVRAKLAPDEAEPVFWK